MSNQAKLFQVRERGLAPTLAAKEEDGKLVAGERALLRERGHHLDVTLGQVVLERKEWRALACRFQVRRSLQPTVTLHADTPSDTLPPIPRFRAWPNHRSPQLSKGLRFGRFWQGTLTSRRSVSHPLKGRLQARFRQVNCQPSQLRPLTIHRAVFRGPFLDAQPGPRQGRLQSSLGDTGCTKVIHYA